MSPSRALEDDPITASYDVFLTSPQQSNPQILLLQYPSRSRDRPYNARSSALPRNLRIKPHSNHLELDVNLSTSHNFNKYRGLNWGEAITTAREVQNSTGTFGLAAGFSHGKVEKARRVVVRDEVDREGGVQDDLTLFYDAENEGRVMKTQTLGGNIIRQDTQEEAGKPRYFVGAFRGQELHLSAVSGTVQMRPQFHHLDAEDQRNRIAASRANSSTDPSDPTTSTSTHPPDQARMVHQSYAPTTINPKGELEQREHEMKSALQASYEEPWVNLEYVDEDDEEAYRVWEERMFVGDVESVPKLMSSMDEWEYLDAISAPGMKGAKGRKRKKATAKGGSAVDVEDAEDEDEDMDGDG